MVPPLSLHIHLNFCLSATFCYSFEWIYRVIFTLCLQFCFCFLHFFCSYDSMFVSVTVARIECHYFAFVLYLSLSLCHFLSCTAFIATRSHSTLHVTWNLHNAQPLCEFLSFYPSQTRIHTHAHTYTHYSNVLNVSYVFVAKQWQKYHGATNECDSIIMWRSMNKTKQSNENAHTHTRYCSRRHHCQVGWCERHTHSVLPFDILSLGSLA